LVVRCRRFCLVVRCWRFLSWWFDAGSRSRQALCLRSALSADVSLGCRSTSWGTMFQFVSIRLADGSIALAPRGGSCLTAPGKLKRRKRPARRGFASTDWALWGHLFHRVFGSEERFLPMLA
jgi:hypothetical protein